MGVEGTAMGTVRVGSRVRFESMLSNGGSARWTAVVVKVEDGIAWVRHPERARFSFSPVSAAGLYKYATSILEKSVVAPRGGKR